MGKKKQLEGNVMSVELPPDEPKKKKEMSDKQRENLAKGMAILKAKREAKSKKEEVEVQEPIAPVVPVAPAPVAPVAAVEKKERKPRVVKNYLTTEDFNSFKSELLGSLKPVQHQKQEYTPPAPVIQPIIQKEIVKERVITGRELLDKIFFN